MMRDWLLTLLALSPYFLAVTIVILALTWKLTQVQRERQVARMVVSRTGREQIARARSTPPHDGQAIMENR